MSFSAFKWIAFFKKARHGLECHFGVRNNIFYHHRLSPASTPLECTVDHLSDCGFREMGKADASQPGLGHQLLSVRARLRGGWRCE